MSSAVAKSVGASAKGVSSPTPSKDTSAYLLEVWGDIVDLRHLRIAVILGASISLTTYAVAAQTLEAMGATSQIDRAYAMLGGLVGCIVSGVVCAWLLPPKRVLQDASEHTASRDDAVAELLTEQGDVNAPIPAATIAELNELGLTGLLPQFSPHRATVS